MSNIIIPEIRTLKQMKNMKAHGKDNITIEMLKMEGQAVEETIQMVTGR